MLLFHLQSHLADLALELADLFFVVLDIVLYLDQLLIDVVLLGLGLLVLAHKSLVLLSLLEYLLPLDSDPLLELFDLMLEGFVLFIQLADLLLGIK